MGTAALQQPWGEGSELPVMTRLQLRWSFSRVTSHTTKQVLFQQGVVEKNKSWRLCLAVSWEITYSDIQKTDRPLHFIVLHFLTEVFQIPQPTHAAAPSLELRPAARYQPRAGMGDFCSDEMMLSTISTEITDSKTHGSIKYLFCLLSQAFALQKHLSVHPEV